MPYYVEDPEGQAPADSLTVATPEEIKLLDPACGSGHMLTYAFDLLVKIYEEEGHAPSEIPEKILTHNLFGLEICPRAAQLASFALVCKARQQSRRAFRSPVQPQVMCLRDVVLTPDEVKGFIDATGTTFSQGEQASPRPGTNAVPVRAFLPERARRPQVEDWRDRSLWRCCRGDDSEHASPCPPSGRDAQPSVSGRRGESAVYGKGRNV